MMHVMAPDERRRRLALGTDLHASERYDGVMGVQRSKVKIRQTRQIWRPDVGIIQPFYFCLCTKSKVDKLVSKYESKG